MKGALLPCLEASSFSINCAYLVHITKCMSEIKQGQMSVVQV